MVYMLRYKHLREHIYNATGYQVNMSDIDDIPEDWLEAILSLEIDVPRKKAVIDEAKRGKRKGNN